MYLLQSAEELILDDQPMALLHKLPLALAQAVFPPG